MTPSDVCLSAFSSSTHATGTARSAWPGPFDALSDEAAVHRLYELATHGANESPEFAQLDALVYERLMDTYERGGGTAGVIHMGASRSA